MLLATLSASLSGNIFAFKRMNGAGKGIIRTGYGSSIKETDF